MPLQGAVEARNANYGVSDVFSNFAGQTELDDDLHFMALDVLHPELIEPQTGAVLPWREGERGELVLTHLSRECQPLVRFRTGDIILLTGTGRAACGRTAPRFRENRPRLPRIPTTANGTKVLVPKARLELATPRL